MNRFGKAVLISMLAVAPAFAGVCLPATLRSLTIRMFVDGSDYVRIRGNRLWIEHRLFSLPGKQVGDTMHNDPTYLEGTAWMPTWRGNVSDTVSLRGLPSVAEAKETDFRVIVRKARNLVEIAQAPSDLGADALSVLLNDDNMGGADWYEVEIVW